MFSDPKTSITISGVNQSMPRIQIDGSKAIYQKADQTHTETISHIVQGGDRVRTLDRLDIRKVVADPLTAENDYQNLGIYVVIDRPNFGFSSADVEAAVTGFLAQFNAAYVAKLYGREI